MATTKPESQSRDVQTVKAIAAKLSRLLEIIVRAKVTNSAGKVAELKHEFDSLLDDLAVMQELTIRELVLSGYATLPERMRDHARTVCNEATGALQMRDAYGDDLRSGLIGHLGGYLKRCRDSCEAVREYDTAGQGADKLNGQSDTPKKSSKKSKRRLLNCHARECIKEFKECKKLDDPRSMLDIVKDYAANHDGVSELGTYKRLTDNGDQW